MGLTGATAYGVEITAKDIEQFQSSTFKENRVYFSCHIDDSTGFGSTSCTQISANSYGEGTYNQIYNKENFEYQYEGLSNRRLWPAQGSVVAAATTPTGALSAASTGVLGANTVGYDVVEVATSTAGLRAGELITLNSVAYEIKYIISSTKFVITSPLTAVVAGTAFLVKYFYDTLTITFADNTFTSGADIQALAQKAIIIATPSINVSSADPFDRTLDTGSYSTEGVELLTNIGAWLAGTPTKISTAVLIA